MVGRCFRLTHVTVCFRFSRRVTTTGYFDAFFVSNQVLGMWKLVPVVIALAVSVGEGATVIVAGERP